MAPRTDGKAPKGATRVERYLARGDRGEAIRAFNYRESSNTAREPTAMQIALLAAAGPPNEQRRPGGGGVETVSAGGFNRHDKATPLGAQLQRLRALYGKAGAP